MKLALLVASLLQGVAAHAAGVEVIPYGKLADGRAVEQVTLRNDADVVVRFITYGGIITAIEVPDRGGRFANVALGFATLGDYEERNGDYRFGAAVGRFAGRIANARFTIDGTEVRLQANDGPNALHGGPGSSLDTHVWTLAAIDPKGVAATLRTTSPAGEQGFPGNLTVTMTYRLLANNALRIDYEATTDAPTVLNLTNHSYFNLAGAGSGKIYEERLQLPADSYLQTDERGIPLKPASVAGTPFDFSKPTALGLNIGADDPQMTGRRGYNHTWLLGNDGKLVRAARLADPSSGRTLEVLTTEPSIHVYTANWFSGKDRGAEGRIYTQHDAVALETQHLPDSPNRPDFPTTALRPGEIFKSTTIYRFGVAKTDAAKN